MKWLDDWTRRWRLAREARRESYLRHLANSNPGFQWLVVRAGTAEQARSPMLAPNEIREWFVSEYVGRRIVEVDHANKIIFYE